MDAKDILGLPKGAPPGDKRARPPKEVVPKKPDRVSREVYALTGGLPPIIASVDTKQRPVSSKKISWQWVAFSNSARDDNLQLYHWARAVDSVVPAGDYMFAKYNKAVSVIKYTDEEYDQHLIDPNWTREETDLLFSLCEQFDLRFIIIADRFSPRRSVEELKDRYYSAAKALILSRATSPDEVREHPHVKDAYNVNYEIDRKRSLTLLLSQSRQQEREDAEVLAEAGRICEVRQSDKKVEEQAEQPLAPGTDPVSLLGPPDSAAAAVPAVAPSPRGHRVFLRGQNLGQMVQSALASAGARAIKRVEQILLDELGVRLEPKVPTESVCREHLELRKEVLALVNLQKQWKESAEVSLNTYSDVALPGTPKKFRGADGARGIGERAGKRDHKRKAPARFSDTPPSPPLQKRARKLKSEI